MLTVGEGQDGCSDMKHQLLLVVKVLIIKLHIEYILQGIFICTEKKKQQNNDSLSRLASKQTIDWVCVALLLCVEVAVAATVDVLLLTVHEYTTTKT